METIPYINNLLNEAFVVKTGISPLSQFDTRSQSYDRELQCQRCKFLQRHG
jgi:hypothetical protein